MGGADLRDMNAQLRVAPNENARRPGVVEMDVREQQVADVRQPEPAFAEPLLERTQAARRPAVEERRPVDGVEQVDADDALVALEAEVERRVERHARAAASAETRACARSSIRSSADSMPTDRRTRLPGAANGASAVDAWVMRAGCSIMLSTPPRLSASFQIRVRPTSAIASSSDAARNEIMPPKSRIWRAAISCPGCASRPG